MQRSGIVDSFSDFYVVFCPSVNFRFLFFLKKDFKHCFLFFGDNYQTFVLDPIINKIEVGFSPVSVFNLKKYFEVNGMKVLKVEKQYKPKRKIGFGVFTCVEVVKRVLGINSFKIITPFQLYKYLNK